MMAGKPLCRLPLAVVFCLVVRAVSSNENCATCTSGVCKAYPCERSRSIISTSPPAPALRAKGGAGASALGRRNLILDLVGGGSAETVVTPTTLLVGNATAIPRPMDSGAISTHLSKFWKFGVLQVHEHYLMLLWDVTRTCAKILFPVSLLLLASQYYGSSSAVRTLVEKWLLRFQVWANTAVLSPLAIYAKIQGMSFISGDFGEIIEQFSLPPWSLLLVRPVCDTLILRCAFRSLWNLTVGSMIRMTIKSAKGKGGVKGLSFLLDWSFWGSIICSLSHLGNTLPSPSPDLLQMHIDATLQTGDLTFLGMTLYRGHWNARLVETLVTTEPLLLALGRATMNGLLSWGILCPLYDLHGFLASIGAQLAWGITGWAHVDTQILLRLLWRIFFVPWSSGTKETRVVATVTVDSVRETLLFRTAVQLLFTWWRQVFGLSLQYQLYMILSSILLTLSEFRSIILPVLDKDKGLAQVFVCGSPLNMLVLGSILQGIVSWQVNCPLYETRGIWGTALGRIVFLCFRLFLGAQLALFFFAHASGNKPEEGDDNGHGEP